MQRLKEIDAARGIGIILVVLGHCIRGFSKTQDPVLKMIDVFIYTFHMPIIFFISGILSAKVLKLNNSERFNYIKTRFIRLIVPYFAASFIWLPFILLLSTFANSPYNLKALPLIFIGESPNGSLWFLYSLFVIQMFVALFANEKNLTLIIFLSAVILSSFEATGLNLHGISEAFIRIPFFILGLWFSLNYRKDLTPPPIV